MVFAFIPANKSFSSERVACVFTSDFCSILILIFASSSLSFALLYLSSALLNLDSASFTSRKETSLLSTGFLSYLSFKDSYSFFASLYSVSTERNSAFAASHFVLASISALSFTLSSFDLSTLSHSFTAPSSLSLRNSALVSLVDNIFMSAILRSSSLIPPRLSLSRLTVPVLWCSRSFSL